MCIGLKGKRGRSPAAAETEIDYQVSIYAKSSLPVTTNEDHSVELMSNAAKGI